MKKGSNGVVQGFLLTLALGACTGEPAPTEDPVMTDQDPTTQVVDRTETRIQEKLLYVVAVEKTEAGATPSPDALFTIDVQPGSPTFGRIIARMDMPNVGDELHHFGYDWDNRHLVINGLFSGRTHIVNVHDWSRRPSLER